MSSLPEWESYHSYQGKAVVDVCVCGGVFVCVWRGGEPTVMFKAGVGGTKEMFAPWPITTMLRY